MEGISWTSIRKLLFSKWSNHEGKKIFGIVAILLKLYYFDHNLWLKTPIKARSDALERGLKGEEYHVSRGSPNSDVLGVKTGCQVEGYEGWRIWVISLSFSSCIFLLFKGRLSFALGEFYFSSIFVRNWGWRLSSVIDNLKAFNNDNLLHCYCLFYNAWLIRGLGWRRKPKSVSSFLIILLCLSLIMLNDLIGSPSWMLFNFWFCKGYLECLLLFMLDLDISCLG